MKILTSVDINNYLGHKKNFVGVYSRDRLPNVLNVGEYIVINYDDYDGAGTHWVSLYHDIESIEFFDSFGVVPSQEVQKLMKNSNNNKRMYNTTQLQYNNSILCGYYCIVFILLKEQGWSMYDILYKFDQKNTIKNESIIKTLWRQLMN